LEHKRDHTIVPGWHYATVACMHQDKTLSSPGQRERPSELLCLLDPMSLVWLLGRWAGGPTLVNGKWLCSCNGIEALEQNCMKCILCGQLTFLPT
jgi:hypothetical protein